MTTTAEQYTAYRHERTCHDLIVLSLSARLYASYSGNCYVKPIAVLHLRVDTVVLRMLIHYSYTTIDDWLQLSESNMTSYA